MVKLFSVLLAVLCGCTCGVVALRSAQDKPNVVMLFVDDLGYGDVGFNGHPTTETPNIDKLAHGGKILSGWYSGCPVCSGSRAALMTGRQFNRVGVPGVFGPTVNEGLPLNETTVAAQLKKAGYKTAAMGKWHLGQREMFLPGARGFDSYLGIPYSDDMGAGRVTKCSPKGPDAVEPESMPFQKIGDQADWGSYLASGLASSYEKNFQAGDKAGNFLPLVHQHDGKTEILEQPLDFSHLGEKYNSFVLDFVEQNKEDPFFLYMPFSHVHTTRNTPEGQYAGCGFHNKTRRGMFGDALSEVDYIVGNLIAKLEASGLDKNTLILFTGDNGPWMIKGKSGGSTGLFYGRTAGYWNVGKGSTWEGGIHEAGFAYWPGQVEPGSKSSEIVSSMDLFPTVSALAGLELPQDRVYDGKDASNVLFKPGNTGKSLHECLFFYGGAPSNRNGQRGPSAARCGKYKAHWATGPGLGGCTNCKKMSYPDVPLIFDIDEDPSEAYPLTDGSSMPKDADIASVVKAINEAFDKEQATFTYGKLTAPPDGPGEGPNMYGVCCDRATKGKNATCDCNGPVTL